MKKDFNYNQKLLETAKDFMTESAYNKLLKEIKEEQQEMQLKYVDDLLEKMEHLANQTIKVDYNPSYQEAQKILQIKRYADAILKNID